MLSWARAAEPVKPSITVSPTEALCVTVALSPLLMPAIFQNRDAEDLSPFFGSLLRQEIFQRRPPLKSMAIVAATKDRPCHDAPGLVVSLAYAPDRDGKLFLVQTTISSAQDEIGTQSVLDFSYEGDAASRLHLVGSPLERAIIDDMVVQAKAIAGQLVHAD